LELTQQEIETVTSMNCFSVDFKGIGHFKECFFFFQQFDFFEKFKVDSEHFFRFLHYISERYTGTSYHNWTHACDVTQCIVFMLYTGRLGDAYEAWELFTLVAAAICHDTNHQGFNNIYNVKAETPLGILFKDTSVMEMHHITQAIPVINMDKVSLFHGFDQAEVKKVWALFIKIILSTDMAKHFELVKRAQGAVDEGSFDMSNEEYRLLGLQLIMKVGDISNVSRPFEIADKWCDILNEEFFHQGDLEKQSGIGLTSPLNDRETSNKPKSQIGFYNFICLPLYTVVAKLYTPLQVQVDQVKSNLERWKALVAAPPT
jgi:3',5'-cyclic-nucleotide phosphodiesterase